MDASVSCVVVAVDASVSCVVVAVVVDASVSCVVVAVVLDASVIRNCGVAVTGGFVGATGTCVVVDVAVVMVETSVMATRRSDVVFNIITL